MIALVGSLIGFIALNIHPNMFFFILCRLLEGFGVQMAATFNQVFIGAFFPSPQNAEHLQNPVSKSQVFSILFKVLIITGMLAPILGSFLMHLVNWQLNFLASAVVITITLFFFQKNKSIYKSKNALENKNTISIYDLKEFLQNIPFLIFCFLSATSTMTIVFYLVKSPFIFMNLFNLTPKEYAFCNSLVILSTVLGVSIVTFGKKYISENQLLHISRYSLIALTFTAWIISSLFALNLVTCTFFISLILATNATLNPIYSSLALDYKISNLTLKSSAMNLMQMIACVLGSCFATYTPNILPYIFGYFTFIGCITLVGGKWFLKK